MSTKTRQKSENWNMILKRYSAYILFFGILIFIPFFMEDGYLNLTQAKAHALYITIIPAAMILGISLCIRGASIRGKRHDTQWKTSINGLDCILIGIAVTALLSSLFSQNVEAAFWGNKGWSVGAATMLSLVAAYFILSRCYARTVNAWFFVLVANMALFLLTILHSMGIDIFGLHAAIVPKQYYLYVSTIGNVNWLSGYLCLILPAFFVFFMLSTQRTSILLYGAALILGIMNVLLCLSESIFVGIWVCAFFALPFVLKESGRVRRLGALLLSFGLCSLLIGLLPAFAGKRARAHGLFSIILDWKAALIICILGCLCCFLLPTLWKKFSPKTIQKIIAVCGIVMVFSLIMLIFVFLNSYNDNWGNNRGRIWNTSMELFRNFNFKDKLIGVGPELLGQYFNGLTSHSLIVLTAHNEWLQWLLTTGISGGILWAALFLWLIISYFRSHCREHEEIPFFLPLMAYLGQAMLNSPNAMNISLFYLFLALYRKNLLG